MNGSENGRSAHGKPHDIHLERFLAVSDILTPVVYEFERKVAEANSNGLVVPSLTGEEPVLLPYELTEKNILFRHNPIFTRNKSNFSFFNYFYRSDPRNPEARIQVPVGQYGTTWSYAVAQTTRAVYSLLEQHIVAESIITDKQHGQILVDEAFRKRTSKILIEAAQTTAAATTLLTPEKVEGFEDDPLALFHALREQDVLNQLGIHAPLGFIFPMVQAGIYFPHPLESQLQEDGTRRVRLSEAFVRFLKKARDESVVADGRRPGQRQKGCPAARKNAVGIDFEGNTRHYKKSAIYVMAGVFDDYLDYFYNVKS